MSKFQRGLSKKLTDALGLLADKPDRNWWKDVLANKGILLAVRGGYLNAYMKGQSVFKIGPGLNGTHPQVKTHYKYLLVPKLEKMQQYILFDGTKFYIKPEDVIQTEDHAGLIANLAGTAARFSGAEKIGIDRIAAEEPKVIDVEIAFTKSGDSESSPTAPRMDLALLIPWDSGGARLVFCEAKCADNVELWKPAKEKESDDAKMTGDKSQPAVIGQIMKYENFISDAKNTKALVDAYLGVCKTLVGLRQQGWKRTIDPLIKRVATGQASLTIHPHVYLLVYGYDSDQKGGAVANKLERLSALLEQRVISKGEAKNFKLSNKIVKRESR